MPYSRLLPIVLSFLLSACSANEIAMQSVSRGDEFEAMRGRQTRVFSRPEATVLAAIRQVVTEDGARIVVDEPTYGAVGAANRRDMSEGNIAGQVAANVAIAVLFGAGAAGPQNIVVRGETRATVLTRPLPDGSTVVRVTLQGWNQRQNRQEFVTASESEEPYRLFFDRLAARLGVPARAAG